MILVLSFILAGIFAKRVFLLINDGFSNWPNTQIAIKLREKIIVEVLVK